MEKASRDVLGMSCGQAVELFSNIPKIRRILQRYANVGLDYLTLGRAPHTLRGEAQRVKLAAELARPTPANTLPIRRANTGLTSTTGETA